MLGCGRVRRWRDGGVSSQDQVPPNVWIGAVFGDPTWFNGARPNQFPAGFAGIDVMETHAEPDFSSDAWFHRGVEARDGFVDAFRGELEAKNKGKLKMYFVET